MGVPCGSPSVPGLVAELVRDFKQLKGQGEGNRSLSRGGPVRVGQPRPTEGGGLGA
jgi:hypothetical protein